jgi:hypothetical protein
MAQVRDALSGTDDFLVLRVVGGLTAVALAVLSAAVNGIDDVFLLLAGLAAVVLAFPWQRLSALRAGPFEFSLQSGQIRGAIDSIDVQGAEKERIESLLARLAPDVERARGSRVLWVDDKPRRLVGERRLFRALDIDTIALPSCREAGETLMRDNDFDLVVTSLEKGKEREAIQSRDNPAVLFGQWLRGGSSHGIRELMGRGVEIPIDDAIVNNLAVVVYAAFPLPYIREKIQPLTAHEAPVDGTNSLYDLLKTSIRLLADLRSNPIEVSGSKKVRAG